jgi:8-oxo-dGTP diphosphatase
MKLHGQALVPGRAEGTLEIGGAPVSVAELPHPASTPELARGRILWLPRLADFVPEAHRGEVAALIVGEPGPEGKPSGATPPAVARLESDLFVAGDRVAVDGALGDVELPNVTGVEVVTSFLERTDGTVLLLRRSQKVGSFQGLWAAVSGFLQDPTPRLQALREIREETGIPGDRLTLADAGEPVFSRAGDRMYVVWPFRWRVEAPEVHLDWEHTDFEWVDPTEIRRRPTVPKLERAWESVRARGKTPGSGKA